MAEQELLTPKQAATIGHVSTKTIFRLMKKGVITYTTAFGPKSTRIYKDQFFFWLDKKKKVAA